MGANIPKWRGVIIKRLGTEEWTNRYIIQAGTIQDAHNLLHTIYTYERTVTGNIVTFLRYRTDDAVKDTDVFIQNDLNTLGSQDYAGAQYLPLFNRAVVDLNTAMGRPSRKYLCLPLVEGHVVNGDITQIQRDFLMQHYVTPLLGVVGHVDVDGQPFVSGTVKQAVGMRQLRRKRKKKVVTP